MSDTPIEVLLLDVGGVLVRAAASALVVELEGVLGLQAGGLNRLLFEQEPWYALSTGRLEEARYWELLGAQTGWEPERLRRLVAPAWEVDGLDQAVVELVRQARGRVRTAVLSNATIRLEERLRALGVAELFDPMVNSARVGMRKPDERLYALTLELLGCQAGAVLFVDDKPRNTRISEGLGIPSITFTGAPELALALVDYGVL